MSNKNGEEIKKNCLGRRLFLRLLIFCLSKQSDCFYFKHQLKQQKRRKGNMKNRIAILTLFQTNNSVNKYIKAKLHPLARKTNLLKCSKNFSFHFVFLDKLIKRSFQLLPTCSWSSWLVSILTKTFILISDSINVLIESECFISFNGPFWFFNLYI